MVYTSWRVREREGRGWLGAISYKDESGRWRKRERKLKATGKRAAEAECREWFDEMNREAEAGARPGRTVLELLGTYVDGCAVSAEASTVYGYRKTVEAHVAPYAIAGTALDALTPAAVRAWLAELSGRYAATTVRKAFTLLRSAVRQAVRDGEMARDPTDGVKPPKAPAPDPNAITEEQRGALAAALAAAEQSAEIVGIRAAFYTGMRRGEVCALRWRDVDLEGRTLTVRASVGT